MMTGRRWVFVVKGKKVSSYPKYPSLTRAPPPGHPSAPYGAPPSVRKTGAQTANSYPTPMCVSCLSDPGGSQGHSFCIWNTDCVPSSLSRLIGAKMQSCHIAACVRDASACYRGMRACSHCSSTYVLAREVTVWLWLSFEGLGAMGQPTLGAAAACYLCSCFA
eukprot:1143638-Pelagomonas_calceolata.AAC.4